MEDKPSKHFGWLKSIRLSVNNGYMCDEDCERIEEYFISQLEKTIRKVYEELPST